MMTWISHGNHVSANNRFSIICPCPQVCYGALTRWVRSVPLSSYDLGSHLTGRVFLIQVAWARWAYVFAITNFARCRSNFSDLYTLNIFCPTSLSWWISLDVSRVFSTYAFWAHLALRLHHGKFFFTWVEFPAHVSRVYLVLCLAIVNFSSHESSFLDSYLERIWAYVTMANLPKPDSCIFGPFRFVSLP